MKQLFYNANIVLPNAITSGSILVDDGVIEALFLKDTEILNLDAKMIDCHNLYLGPGFVDIHVHGGKGIDFVSAPAEDIVKGIDYHLTMGTTSLTPSCLSIPFSHVPQAIENAKKAAKMVKGTVPGFHVEGIYFCEQYRGGHLKEYLRTPDPKDYMPIIENYGDFITEWTLAPELSGSIDLIKRCSESGIITSAGHSQADYDTIMEAIDAGLTHSTHFACVMGNLRFEALGKSSGKGFAPGLLETVLLDDRLTTEVIADGHHLHPAIIKLAVKCKGTDRVCIVSDCMMGAGLPAGEYLIGGQDCIVEHGLAIIKDRPEVIASSVTPIIDMLRFVVNCCSIPLTDAWKMAALTPARIINADKKKGSIKQGKDADFLLLNNNLDICCVYTSGKLAWGEDFYSTG